MGFGANAAISLHYSFIKELCIGKISQRMIILLQVSFSFGLFFIAMLSWLISNWKLTLALFILAPSSLLLIVKDWI